MLFNRFFVDISSFPRVMSCLVFLLLMISGSALSASFDCALAKSDIEKLVCSSANLGKADELLGKEYAELRASLDVEQKKILLVSQRKWLRNNNTCLTEKYPSLCLTESYKKRLVAFRNFKALNFLPGSEEQEAACNFVAGLEPGNYPETKEGQAYDINNDDVQEVLKYEIYGSDQVATYLDSAGKSVFVKVNSADEYVDWSRQISIPYNGKNYFLYVAGDVKTLVYPTPQNVGYELCSYERSRSLKLVASKSSICERVKSNSVKLLKGRRNEKMKGYQSMGAFKSPVGLMHVDIDNDGNIDSVQKLNVAITSGLGCGFEILSLLETDQKTIIQSPLNDLLSKHGRQCNGGVEVFTDKGVAYIQYLEPDFKQTLVASINAGEMEQYCKFTHEYTYKRTSSLALPW